MTWDEVQSLKDAGMEIGSMGARHLDLTTVSREEARADLDRSRDSIRGFVGTEADYFSYPFSRLDANTKEIVKEAGFRGAVYTPPGRTGGMDRHSLRRVMIRSGLSEKAFQFKLTEQADSLRENPKMFGIMKALGKAFD